MTWSYSNDPKTSPKDEVRFIIGDTDPKYAFLQDEEILYILEQEKNSVTATAISAVRRIIAQVARQVNYTIGPEKVEASQRLSNFQTLLTTLLEEFNSLGHIELSQPAAHSPIFDLGMNDYYTSNRVYYPNLMGTWIP